MVFVSVPFRDYFSVLNRGGGAKASLVCLTFPYQAAIIYADIICWGNVGAKAAKGTVVFDVKGFVIRINSFAKMLMPENNWAYWFRDIAIPVIFLGGECPENKIIDGFDIKSGVKGFAFGLKNFACFPYAARISADCTIGAGVHMQGSLGLVWK